MPEPLTFFLLLPLSSIFFFSKNSHGNILPPNCSSYNCGGLNISYPFWLWSNITPNQYCGYPGFSLNCSDGETIFNLQGQSFYVKNINYTSKTLTLVDTEVSTQTCPRLRQNVTLQPLPLSYSSLDLNLTFYYNCSGLEIDIPSIDCLSDTAKKSYAVLGVTDPLLFGKWYNFCEEKVVAMVATDAKANETNSISGFDGPMKDGFVLDWHQDSACSLCEDWYGWCGYNEGNNSYLCFYLPDRSPKGTLFLEYFQFKLSGRVIRLKLFSVWIGSF